MIVQKYLVDTRQRQSLFLDIKLVANKSFNIQYNKNIFIALFPLKVTQKVKCRQLLRPHVN